MFCSVRQMAGTNGEVCLSNCILFDAYLMKYDKVKNIFLNVKHYVITMSFLVWAEYVQDNK